MVSPEYIERIRDAYEGERVAEGYFRRLAEQAENPLHRRAYQQVADVEAFVHGMLEPLAAGLGIHFSEAERASRVERRLVATGERTWDAFIQQAISEWPAYVEWFEELAQMALPGDEPLLRTLVEHERALVKFAHRVAQNDPTLDTLAPLNDFLDAHAGGVRRQRAG